MNNSNLFSDGIENYSTIFPFSSSFTNRSVLNTCFKDSISPQESEDTVRLFSCKKIKSPAKLSRLPSCAMPITSRLTLIKELPELPPTMSLDEANAIGVAKSIPSGIDCHLG